MVDGKESAAKKGRGAKPAAIMPEWPRQLNDGLGQEACRFKGTKEKSFGKKKRPAIARGPRENI